MSPLSPPPTTTATTQPWRPRRPTRQWRLFLLSVALTLVIIAVLERTGTIGYPSRGGLSLGVGGSWGLVGGLPGLGLGQSRKVKRLRVAVVEPTPFHSEVIAGVLGVLDDLGLNSTAYTFGREISNDIAVLRPLSPLPLWGGDLSSALENGDFDIVVLNSCDAKFWLGSEQAKAFAAIVDWGTHRAVSTSDTTAASARRVICIPHEIEYYGERESDDAALAPLASAGSLDFVALAPHAAASLAKTLHSWSARLGRGYWEKCAMGVEGFVPIFPLPASIPPRTPREGMHKAGIVGRIRMESRDYGGVFSDLEQAILHNPNLWGYNVINDNIPNSTRSVLKLVPMGRPDADNPNPQRVPDYTNTSEAFTLHLIGYAEERPVIPPLLNDSQWPVVRVVEGHVESYYGAIRDMDVIVPAFADDAYFEARASASIPAAVMAETPLLVTTRHLQSYTYLNLYPPTHITHPLALDAINALGTLRRGADPWAEEFGNSYTPAAVLRDWDAKAAPRDWAEFAGVLRRWNARVWAGVLARAV